MESLHPLRKHERMLPYNLSGSDNHCNSSELMIITSKYTSIWRDIP